MKKRDLIAIWLADEYARKVLGLFQATPSRWIVVGRYKDDESIGLWIAVDHIEERGSNARVVYSVSPKMCLLKWEGIITIQRLKKGSIPEIGIKKDASKEKRAT